jgi:hypothetical protein
MMKIEILHSNRAKLTRRDGATTEVEWVLPDFAYGASYWRYENGIVCSEWISWRLNRALDRYLAASRERRMAKIWHKPEIK